MDRASAARLGWSSTTAPRWIGEGWPHTSAWIVYNDGMATACFAYIAYIVFIYSTL